MVLPRRPRQLIETRPDIPMPTQRQIARATLERGSEAVLAIVERDGALRAVTEGSTIATDLKNLVDAMVRASGRLDAGSTPEAPALEASVKRLDDLVNHLVVLEKLVHGPSEADPAPLSEVTGVLADLIRATVELRGLLRRGED